MPGISKFYRVIFCNPYGPCFFPNTHLNRPRHEKKNIHDKPNQKYKTNYQKIEEPILP